MLFIPGSSNKIHPFRYFENGRVPLQIVMIMGFAVIVIAIVYYVVVDPSGRLAEKRNTQRRAGVSAIIGAVDAFSQEKERSALPPIPLNPICIGDGPSAPGSGIHDELDPTQTQDGNGLILLWHMNEGSGTKLEDASGHGNGGTLTVGPEGAQATPEAAWQNGAGQKAFLGGQALPFDGTDDFVRISNVVGLAAGNSPHSIEAWIKVASYKNITTRAWILLLGRPAPGSHHWLITGSGKTGFGSWGSSVAQSSPPLPVGQWTHLAVTFDGTTMRSYVDGSLYESVSAGFNFQQEIPFTLALKYEGENFFAGIFDEVAVYNRALSAAEIRSHVAHCYDLARFLVPKYLAEIPADPKSKHKQADTGYTIRREIGLRESIVIDAPMAELGESILAIR